MSEIDNCFILTDNSTKDKNEKEVKDMVGTGSFNDRLQRDVTDVNRIPGEVETVVIAEPWTVGSIENLRVVVEIDIIRVT